MAPSFWPATGCSAVLRDVFPARRVARMPQRPREVLRRHRAGPERAEDNVLFPLVQTGRAVTWQRHAGHVRFRRVGDKHWIPVHISRANDKYGGWVFSLLHIVKNTLNI